LRERFRAATREAILQAAAGLLMSDDSTQFRMEDIASGAGIAVGTLYNYFEDRTALVTALLESQTRTLFEALDAVDGAARPSAKSGAAAAFEADLERFVSAVGRHFNANRFLLNVLVEEERQHGIDARAASRRRTVVGEMLTRAERLMEKGTRARALRKGSPSMYAALLVGMMRGLAISALVRGEPFPADGSAEIARVFLKGASR
jgi:AcrR family transcriptional regulator